MSDRSGIHNYTFPSESDQVVQSPYRNRRAKGSIFQGGINAPMVISGAGVTRKGEREDAVIQSTDLFTTIAQMAGSNISEKHNS